MLRHCRSDDARATVSTADGSQPRWRADGKELFFVAADARLMAVPIRVRADRVAVDAGIPATLFPTRHGSGPTNIAIQADHQRLEFQVSHPSLLLQSPTAVGSMLAPV